MELGANKSKESLISVNKIHNRSQASNRSGNDEIKQFEKSQDLSQLLQSSLQKVYKVDNMNEDGHNPAYFNPDALYDNSQNLFANQHKMGKPKNMFKNSNCNIKNSFSGLSFESLGQSELRMKESSGIYNPALHLQNSLPGGGGGGENLIKISAKDLNRLDPLKEESEEGSQHNSLVDLFNNEQTPLLFRGNSGVIDPKTLKRK